MAKRKEPDPTPPPRRQRFSRFDPDPQPPPQVLPAGTTRTVAVPDEPDAIIASSNGNGTKSKRKDLVTYEAMSKQSVHLKQINESFTAAAMLMDPLKAPTGGFPSPNAVTRTWQHAAWGYVRSVPELNAAQLFVGNALSRCKLIVGKRNPDGSVDQMFDGDSAADDLDPALKAVAAQAAELINELQMPRGGQSEMLRSLGEKIFVVGEAYVVPEDKVQGNPDAGMVFEVLSTQELIPDGMKYKRYYGPGWGVEDLPEGSVPIRIWRADGQYQMNSTSSVRSCLEVLEELVVLTRLVRAAAISRMSLAGVLVVPEELDTPDEDGGPDGDQAEEKNPLLVEMINTGAKAIDDPASAAAWMPFLLQGPAEFIDKVRHIPFQTDDRENVIKRQEAVERLARGLDLPPEKVLGHMGTTFANAAQIDQDNFNLYIEPTLQLICDALTVCYLWPAMALGMFNIDADHLLDAPIPDEIMQVAITYDARKLVSKPDRTKDIIEVYNKDDTFMTIKISEMREALGLDPDDGPDDQEIAKRIDAYRLGRIREVIPAPPSDAAVPIADASAGRAVIPGQSGGAAIAGTGEARANAASAAAKQAIEDAANDNSAALLAAAAATDPLRFLAIKIAGAAELAVDRAVEKYGARIRTKGRGQAMTDTEKRAIASIDNSKVARILGPEVVQRVLGDTDDPMLAEIGTFSKKVASWARQAECDDDKHVAGEAATVVLTLAHQALYATPVDITPDLFGEAILGVRVGVPV